MTEAKTAVLHIEKYTPPLFFSAGTTGRWGFGGKAQQLGVLLITLQFLFGSYFLYSTVFLFTLQIFVCCSSLV